MADSQDRAYVPGEGADLRTYTIIIYGLYLASFPTVGFSTVIGVILAYVKQQDVRGTIYESHFRNVIDMFWVALAVGVVGLVTLVLGIGFFILFGLFIWYYYRAIKGLVRTIDARPFTDAFHG